MTLQEAVEAGHRRVRLPYWAFPEDYILLDILLDDNARPVCGPWGKLYSPVQLTISECDRPQIVYVFPDESTTWEPYEGPPAAEELPGVDERGPQPDWGDIRFR